MAMNMSKAVLPVVGIGMAAAAVGVTMSLAKPTAKKKMQTAAGKALKAVGEVVENFSGTMMAK